MPTCEITGSNCAVRITYNLTQDVEQNESVVRVKKVEIRALASVTAMTCFLTGSVSVNGTKAANLALTDTAGCSVTLSQSYSGGGEGNSRFSGFSTKDITVAHAEDGSARISIHANLSLYYNQNKLDIAINKTVYVELPQIPRVSALTAEGVALGQEMTIQLTRPTEGCTDTVAWSCGSLSGIIAEQTSEDTLSWTVPMELASQAPEDTQVAVVLTVTTFLEGNQVGTKQTTIACPIPESILPTLAVTVEDRAGWVDKYGAFIQSQSQARVLTTAMGAYGSTIQAIAVRCGRLSGTGEDVCFSLEDSGSVAVSVTVTDSRGRTASADTTITVFPYQKPWVRLREAFRCDETGAPQPDGLWMKVVFDGAVTALEGNSAVYHGMCTVHAGEDTRTVLLADYTGVQTVTEGYFLLTAGLDAGYDCSLTVRDDFCTARSDEKMVSVAFALLDFCRGTKAVGIGMRAKNAGMLSIGLDTDMEEHSIGNLADPEQNQDAATKAYVDRLIDVIFPVGYVYLSTADVSPASLFGGTWERIKDVFLLAAGDTYEAGTTGGEAEHTLTIDEMPEHNHSFATYGVTVAGGSAYNRPKNASTYSSTHSYKSTPRGGGLAHNNMPPYLAVYMWKRVV